MAGSRLAGRTVPEMQVPLMGYHWGVIIICVPKLPQGRLNELTFVSHVPRGPLHHRCYRGTRKLGLLELFLGFL